MYSAIELATPGVSNTDIITAPSSPPAGDQHLIVAWQEVLYAVKAHSVREIHWLPELTPLAEAAPYLIGVINLRGRIVPVMDLSLRLRQRPQPYTIHDCIVVLEQDGQLFAIIVNHVHGVQNIAPSQTEYSAGYGRGADTAPTFISGMAKVEQEIVMMLDIAHLLLPAHREKLDESLQEFEGGWSSRSSPGFEYVAEEERATFRERARRLMPSQEAGSEGEQAPVALLMLNGEYYGVALGAVREFAELRHLTPVPCCPEQIIGQTNLRGDIVTLLDIQPLLQMPPRNSGDSDAVVVVVQNENAPVGIVVDKVLDVVYLGEHDWHTSVAHAVSDSKYFNGSFLHAGRVIYQLDLEKILSDGGLVVDEVV